MKKIIFSCILAALGVAGSNAQVSISLQDALELDGSYVKTFVSNQDLDFTGRTDIKAYVAKKTFNEDNEYVESVVLSPIEKVPAGTGVLVKGEAAQTYLVDLASSVDATDIQNDLAVTTERVDLYNAVSLSRYNEFVSGPALLEKRAVETIDWSTYSYVTKDVTAFFYAEKPEEEGTDFLEAGTVYLPLSEEEVSWYNYDKCVSLAFTDIALSQVGTISQLKALASDTPVELTTTLFRVTYVGDSYIVLEDATGGIFVENAGFNVNTGDYVTGSIKGNFNKSILFPLIQATVSTVPSELSVLFAGNGKADGIKVESLEDAFQDKYLQKLVQLKDAKIIVNTVKGSYGDYEEYTLEKDGTEVNIENFLYADIDFDALKDGDEIEEIVGYPVVLSEDNYYYENLYQFNPVSIKLKEATPTGITTVEEQPKSEGLYNLNGQRLSAPGKGIVIRNGKKLVVK